MHWIRRNSRFGFWAAIFALAIQLILSFGHIHLADLQGSSAAIASSSQLQSSTSDDEDHGAGHNLCAICVALNLTSSSLLPAVALLATPVDHAHRWVADLQPVQISHRVHFLFQPRAPPHSV
jgi:hypothetical protein